MCHRHPHLLCTYDRCQSHPGRSNYRHARFLLNGPAVVLLHIIGQPCGLLGDRQQNTLRNMLSDEPTYLDRRRFLPTRFLTDTYRVN
jgi:hypothetical protein